MLQFLLLLLPTRITEKEILFHRDFVVHSYFKYYRRLEATGYRDREELVRIRQRVAYSMQALKWQDRGFYKAYRRFFHRAWKLSVRMIKSPERIHEVAPIPYLVIDGATITRNPDCR